MDTSPLDTNTAAQSHPWNLLWVAFVVVLLMLALALGYALAHAVETHWVLRP